MRLRKRAAGLTFGVVVLFLLATNVQAGWLFAICALMIGATVAGLLLPGRGLAGLRVELVAPPEAEQGVDTFVDLRLTNAGRSVRWSLVVSDAHLAPTDVAVTTIKPGETIELTTMRAPLRRGPERTETVALTTSAPFGVAERRRRVAADSTTLVVPRVFSLGPLPFVEPIGSVQQAVHSQPRRGSGPEYLGIREYRPGDSMRHVHWPSTARHGSIMVREFEEEFTRRVAIVVDTERDVGDVWTPLDRSCSAAASIASATYAHGHGARLVAAMPDGSVDVLSRADERDVLRWLASLEPSGVKVSTVIERLGPSELRGAESAVVVAAAWENADPSSAVGRLRRRVPRVVVLGVGTDGGEHRRDDALYAFGARAVATGIETYMWPVERELAECLELGR